MKKPTAYKVVARNPKTNRQIKKRVYTSLIDFDKYSPDTIKRYERVYGIAEVYYFIDGYWQDALYTQNNKQSF